MSFKKNDRTRASAHLRGLSDFIVSPSHLSASTFRSVHVWIMTWQSFCRWIIYVDIIYIIAFCVSSGFGKFSVSFWYRRSSEAPVYILSNLQCGDNPSISVMGFYRGDVKAELHTPNLTSSVMMTVVGRPYIQTMRIDWQSAQHNDVPCSLSNKHKCVRVRVRRSSIL